MTSLDDMRRELRRRFEELMPRGELIKELLMREREARIKAGIALSPVYQYVIDNGTTFEKIPLTPQEKGIVERARESWSVVPKIGECFRNGMMMWRCDNRLKYCEGFCSPTKEKVSYATYHAWNCLYGKLVDVTPPEKYHYFGVMFPDEITDKYLKRAFREREYTAILDDYLHGWEFLREKGYVYSYPEARK